MKEAKFEVWSTRKFSITKLRNIVKWFWHLKASNGKIIAQGDTNGYYNRVDLEDTINTIQREASRANTTYL